MLLKSEAQCPQYVSVQAFNGLLEVQVGINASYCAVKKNVAAQGVGSSVPSSPYPFIRLNVVRLKVISPAADNAPAIVLAPAIFALGNH